MQVPEKYKGNFDVSAELRQEVSREFGKYNGNVLINNNIFNLRQRRIQSAFY
jgi:hypothetical protein